MCVATSTAVLLSSVRLEETFDMSTTVKFVYIKWSGPNVAFAKKGKFGVVQGSIEQHFSVSSLWA